MRIRTVVMVLAALAGVAIAVLTPASAHDPAPAAARASVSPGLVVLHRWDAARARAWAAGDPAALRRLYAPGSRAGHSDVALLRRYLARGLVVTGLRRQVLSAQVVRDDGQRLVLRVTDRLIGAVVVSTEARVRLPASAPLTRRLELRRSADGWRMALVKRPVRQPAPP